MLSNLSFVHFTSPLYIRQPTDRQHAIRVCSRKKLPPLNDCDSFATSSKDLNHKINLARSPITKMSAAQLLNPKAESRVRYENKQQQIHLLTLPRDEEKLYVSISALVKDFKRC
jgi:hypothetical protein